MWDPTGNIHIILQQCNVVACEYGKRVKPHCLQQGNPRHESCVKKKKKKEPRLRENLATNGAFKTRLWLTLLLSKPFVGFLKKTMPAKQQNWDNDAK